MSDEPGDWESALISAGYVEGRGANRASWRRLAQEVGVHQTTLKYMRTGERDTDQATVDAVAGALRLDPRTVAEWVGRARSERAPYVPPSDAHLLDHEEREVVEMLATLRLRRSPTGHRPRAPRRTCTTCATRQSGSRPKTIRPWPHATNASMGR